MSLVNIKFFCAVAVVLGHIFRVIGGFWGGKGVGTLAGVGLALYPIALLIVLGIFIITFAISRYVSLSSVLGSVSFPFIVYFITDERNLALLGLAVFVAFFIPTTHLKNIKRLLKGEENRFNFRRKKV